MPLPIKHIVFDLGAVLLHIDYQRTINAFQALGVPEPVKAFSREHQAALFQAYEVGSITSTEFIEGIRTLLPTPASDAQIIEAWCALLGEMPHSTFALLQSLKAKNYRLYVLSNTNAMHQQRFEQHIDERFGWDAYAALFQEIYYSHKVGMRKPNADIFEYVIERNGIVPLEALFIDDTEMHIETARSLGINTIHLRNKSHLEDVLRAYLA